MEATNGPAVQSNGHPPHHRQRAQSDLIGARYRLSGNSSMSSLAFKPAAQSWASRSSSLSSAVMLNGPNFDPGGFALSDPLHRFPAVRPVQPKLPIVFVSRHFGVVPASRCFFLEKIIRVLHLKHQTKNSCPNFIADTTSTISIIL
jgi:hypothetical protein